MKIIYCRFFPPKGYLAKRLFGIWFVRKGVTSEEEVRKIIGLEDLRIGLAKEASFRIGFWEYIKGFVKYIMK